MIFDHNSTNFYQIQQKIFSKIRDFRTTMVIFILTLLFLYKIQPFLNEIPLNLIEVQPYSIKIWSFSVEIGRFLPKISDFKSKLVILVLISLVQVLDFYENSIFIFGFVF